MTCEFVKAFDDRMGAGFLQRNGRKMAGPEPQPARSVEILYPVVNEHTALRIESRGTEKMFEDAGIRFANPDISADGPIEKIIINFESLPQLLRPLGNVV